MPTITARFAKCITVIVATLLMLLPLTAALARPAPGAAAAGQKKAEVKSPKPVPAVVTPGGPVVEPAPVMLGGEVLFNIREILYSFSPEDRARLISEKLGRLAGDPATDPSRIIVRESGDTADVLYGDTVMLTVTDVDALAENMSRDELARRDAQSIKAALEKGAASGGGMEGMLTSAGWAALLTLALVLVLFLKKRLFVKILSKLSSWKGTKIKPLTVQGVEVISAGRIDYMLIRSVKLVRTALSLALLYLYTMLALAMFPQTRKYEVAAMAHLKAALLVVWRQFVSYLPDLLLVVVIVAILYYVIKTTGYVFRLVESGKVTIPGFYKEWARPTYNIARLMIIAFGAVVLFPYLPGSGSSAFRGVSIFIGVLLSLGSTSIIANMVAGVVLTYMRAFSLGDRVQIGDTTGDVIEKTLLVTRVRTIKHVEIAIPNSMVIGAHIINFSASAADEGLILNTTVTIGYDADWRKVHELLISAAKATENVLEEPKPFVLQKSLDDFYVCYEINAYTKKPYAMARTYSELHQNIQDRFNEAGVEIMSPHYSAVRDGNTMAVPEKSLPKDYRPGGFRLFNWPGSGG